MNRVITRMVRAWESSPYAGAFTHVVVYAGTGNNAGDALGWAAQMKLPTTLRQVGRLTYEAKHQYDLLEDFTEELPDFSGHERILIIDGLLGTGAGEALRPIYREFVAEMNALRQRFPTARIVAVDIPSGMDCDADTTPELAVQADMTMCIGCVKPGLLSDAGTAFTGRIIAIEMPEIEFEEQSTSVLEPDLIRAWLPRRGYDTYKNRQGHVAIVAGSRGYIGAAQIAAEAAQAVGAGLVTLYCRDEAYDILAARVRPEIMVQPLGDGEAFFNGRYDCALIGPGLGTPAEELQQRLAQFVSSPSCPVVLDADGINLAAVQGWTLPAQVLLTPHPGEMARLIGKMPDSRLKWVEQFLSKHEAAVLLKGARSIIASRESIYYNATGGPFMANGGQGDALAGCIASLCAQGTDLLHAAACGAWVCGAAAERAQVQAGLVSAISASQMIAQLPRACVELSY